MKCQKSNFSHLQSLPQLKSADLGASDIDSFCKNTTRRKALLRHTYIDFSMDSSGPLL
jgi:hypothetical protein